MPKYRCPKCGKTVELPPGKYYCKECSTLFKKVWMEEVLVKSYEKVERYRNLVKSFFSCFFDAVEEVRREEGNPYYREVIKKIARGMGVSKKLAERVLWHLVYYTGFKYCVWFYPCFRGKPQWVVHKDFYRYVCATFSGCEFGWDSLAYRYRPKEEEVNSWIDQAVKAYELQQAEELK
jgi:hypothetical protein